MVSCVVKVLLATMNSVLARVQPRAARGVDVVAVDVAHEVQAQPGKAGVQRRHHHLRARGRCRRCRC
jgi:hypothetical protein